MIRPLTSLAFLVCLATALPAAATLPVITMIDDFSVGDYVLIDDGAATETHYLLRDLDRLAVPTGQGRSAQARRSRRALGRRQGAGRSRSRDEGRYGRGHGAPVSARPQALGPSLAPRAALGASRPAGSSAEPRQGRGDWHADGHPTQPAETAGEIWRRERDSNPRGPC